MIKVAIVEDEINILDTLQRIFIDYCQETEIIGTASNVNTAISLLQNDNIDLAVLDISIPGGTIFDVLKEIKNVRFKIIFLTAFEEYAIQAIKFSAFDYLLKPIDPLEFIKSVNIACKAIRKENSNIQVSALLSNIGASSDPQMIILKTSESIHLTNVNEITRCESDSSYTTFYLTSGKQILVSKTLKEYDELLSPSCFFRAHQSHLVNLKQIDRFERREGGYLVMKDKSNIPVSYRKRDALLKALENICRS